MEVKLTLQPKELNPTKKMIIFIEVSKQIYDYSRATSNVICDSIGVGCWCTPNGNENETDRYAYQRLIDDRRNLRTDKKLYKMVGFIDWGNDGIPHYFLSNDSYESIEEHIKDMQKFYKEKGWVYDGPFLD